MSDRDNDARQTVLDTVPPCAPLRRCQLCGAQHDETDPILCKCCGEPVLLWGWAP